MKNRDSPIIYIGSRCMSMATARRFSRLSPPGDPTPVAAAGGMPTSTRSSIGQIHHDGGFVCTRLKRE